MAAARSATQDIVLLVPKALPKLPLSTVISFSGFCVYYIDAFFHGAIGALLELAPIYYGEAFTTISGVSITGIYCIYEVGMLTVSAQMLIIVYCSYGRLLHF